MELAHSRWQIVVEDPEALVGESVWAFLTWIGVADFGEYVVINEPHWIAKMFTGDHIVRNQSIIVGTLELLATVKQCDQIDWFTFMFVESLPLALAIADMKLYKQQLELVGLSIRGVDNGYFYVYTHISEVAQRLIERYPAAEVDRRPIDELDFPY